MKRTALACTALTCLSISTGALAAEAPYSDTLLGDVGGMRSTLAGKGVEVSLDYTGDVWTVTNGGKKRMATYLDLIELRTNIDGEKLFGIKGNSMSISVIDNNGASTNTGTVGSTQGIDNAEVAVNGVRLFEAWVQQNFMDDRLSVLFGLHDLNSEFIATEMSDNFIKPTMQVPQTFAQSGSNGPSIYPTTALAGRVKYAPTEETYVAVAAYDGIPGDPDRTSSSAVKLNDKDALMFIGEVGFTPKAADSDGQPNKLAVGVWHYTGGLDDLTELDTNGDPAKSTAQGVYLLSSYRFYHDKKSGRDLGAFLRGGVADGDTAQVDWDYEAGLVANGWIPGREEGEIGLGISAAHNGDKHMDAQAAASTAADRNEYSYELYYRDTVAPGITIQPDVQYVVNPGTDAVTDNATVVGLRLGVSF